MSTIKHTFIAMIAYVLALAVTLSCLHAKDLVSYQVEAKKIAQSTRHQLEEIKTKAIGELHTHVDKTALKHAGMVKVSSDQTVAPYSRQLRAEQARYAKTFSTSMMQMILMFRIAYAAAR